MDVRASCPTAPGTRSAQSDACESDLEAIATRLDRPLAVDRRGTSGLPRRLRPCTGRTFALAAGARLHLARSRGTTRIPWRSSAGERSSWSPRPHGEGAGSTCRSGRPSTRNSAEHRFVVLTIALDRSAEDARPWIEAARPTHPALIDTRHVVADLYNMVNVPTVVWIDERRRHRAPQRRRLRHGHLPPHHRHRGGAARRAAARVGARRAGPARRGGDAGAPEAADRPAISRPARSSGSASGSTSADAPRRPAAALRAKRASWRRTTSWSAAAPCPCAASIPWDQSSAPCSATGRRRGTGTISLWETEMPARRETTMTRPGSTVSAFTTRSAGAALRVLLTHGYSSTGRAWADQHRALWPTRYRVITWDMRGHGETESPADPAAVLACI